MVGFWLGGWSGRWYRRSGDSLLELQSGGHPMRLVRPHSTLDPVTATGDDGTRSRCTLLGNRFSSFTKRAFPLVRKRQENGSTCH